MKKYWILLIALFSFVGMAHSGESTHVRLLLHGQREIKHGWGVAGWLIGADISTNPNKWVAIYGPRYQSKNWWLEVLGGAVVDKGQPTWIADVRFCPPNLASALSSWLNVRPYFPQAGRTWQLYWYGAVDLALPFSIGKAGLETENMHRPGKDSLAFGPHLIVGVSKNLKISTVYQWHRQNEGNQWWFRGLVDF